MDGFILPRAVEQCVQSIIPELKKEYPDEDEDEIRSRAYAICQDRYNKSHGETSDMDPQHKIERSTNKMFYYKSERLERFSTLSEAINSLRENIDAPVLFGLESKDVQSILLQEAMPKQNISVAGNTDLFVGTSTGTDSMRIYDSAPISTMSTLSEASGSARREDDTHVFVKGEAIHVGVTKNQNLYTAKELERAAPTLAGKPIQEDHSMLSHHNVGKVLVSAFDRGNGVVTYVGRIRKDHSSEAVKAVMAGDLDTVSIGATAEDIKCSICGKSKVFTGCRHIPGMKYEDKTATAVGVGIEFQELSLTPIPADARASAGLVSSTFTYDNIEKAIVALAESYQATGGSNLMSTEPEINEELKKKNDEIKSLQEQLDTQKTLMEQQKRKAAAEKVANMKFELGLITPKQIENEVNDLMEKSVEAIELVGETLSKQLAEMDRSVASRGIVSNEPINARGEFDMSAHEAKEMIRSYLGLPKATPEAREAVANRIRFDEYHPGRQYYFGDLKEDNR